jgi:capsule polysaccharide export protein KpsE/RkpR
MSFVDEGGGSLDSAAVAPVELTVADFGDLLRRNRWLLSSVPLALAAVVSAWNLSVPRSYTSVSAFSVGGGAGASSAISGIAAQFGLSGGSGSSEGPVFFSEVVRSVAVLAPLADSVVNREERATPLWQVFGIEAADQERRRAMFAEVLREQVAVNVTPATGIVQVRVSTNDPEISRSLARLLLAELERFNLRRRQEQAARERAFAESQLVRVREEVDVAEDRLTAFSLRNRQYSTSPALMLEFERMQRELANRQSQAAELEQTYNQALLEEARNVPRLSVLETASLPLRPNPRGTVPRALAGLLAGFFLALGFVLGREYLRASAAVRSARPH